MDNYENVVHSQRQTKLILKIEYCIVHNAFEKLKKKNAFLFKDVRLSHVSSEHLWSLFVRGLCVRPLVNF